MDETDSLALVRMHVTIVVEAVVDVTQLWLTGRSLAAWLLRSCVQELARDRAQTRDR